MNWVKYSVYLSLKYVLCIKNIIHVNAFITVITYLDLIRDILCYVVDSKLRYSIQ
jgi:hypothetical protein